MLLFSPASLCFAGISLMSDVDAASSRSVVANIALTESDVNGGDGGTQFTSAALTDISLGAHHNSCFRTGGIAPHTLF